MLCPRRGEDLVGGMHNVPDEDNWYERDGGRHCSYCGSQHPDDFMAHLEAGGEVTPTDKNYKVYVKGGPFTKFYFQHLSEVQRQRFIGLLNEHKFMVGFPGHFYVLPFFVRKG